jgi:hypothetical protein
MKGKLMKPHELEVDLLNMESFIHDAVNDLTTDLSRKFVGTSEDNEKADKECNAHDAMIDYIISSRENSYWKKRLEKSKKSLDECVVALGTNSSGVPEDTVELHSSNLFTFSKRRNKDGTSTLVVDLVTALSRLGVEKSIINAAIDMAAKPKRGNIYYYVKVKEE